MPITIPLVRINRFLALALIALTLAGLGVEVARYGFEREGELTRLLSLSHETNIPTWYSSSVLLCCSFLLALIAAMKKGAGGAFRGHWVLLAVGFLYISMDETAQIHENLNQLLDLHGIFYFTWVIPVGILVLVLALIYARFVLHLPSRTRLRFLGAGVAYVGGALGVELVLGYWTDLHGDENLTYAMIDLVEESLEILGMSMFLSALLEYIGTLARDLRFSIAAAAPAPGPGARP